MSIDPEDLKRLEEGRWPTSWKAAPRITRPGERLKVMLALASGGVVITLLVGWPVYNLLAR